MPEPRDTAAAHAPAALGPILLDAAAVLGHDRLRLVDDLEAALAAGLDPESDLPRSHHPTPAGQLLLMPSASPDWVGAKLLGVAPQNASQQLPAIQGLYVLLDGPTLTPRAVLDGAALTTLRTPAVSVLVLRHLAVAPVRRAVVLGTGVQAGAHVDALLRCTDVEHVDVVGRDAARAGRLAAVVSAAGRTARTLAHGADGERVLRGADVVVCATSSPVPLFGADVLDERSTVLAVGSYQPHASELAPALVARSQVVVESRASALREAGDVLGPVRAGSLAVEDLLPMVALVTGAAAADPGRPRVFKGTGMAWQDLVAASSVFTAHQGEQRR